MNSTRGGSQPSVAKGGKPPKPRRAAAAHFSRGLHYAAKLGLPKAPVRTQQAEPPVAGVLRRRGVAHSSTAATAGAPSTSDPVLSKTSTSSVQSTPPPPQSPSEQTFRSKRVTRASDEPPDAPRGEQTITELPANKRRRDRTPAEQTTAPPSPIDPKDTSRYATMPIQNLVGIYLNYLKDIRSRIAQIEPPTWMTYYVWATPLVPGAQSLPEPTTQKMLEMRLDRSLAEGGIVTLNPQHRDYALPVFEDPCRSGQRLCQLIIKANVPDKDSGENILCVALICQGNLEQHQVYDGLYEVEVVLADTTGMRVFFNSPEQTLGRIEFRIDDSSTLPTWHLQYMKHVGKAAEAESLQTSRRELDEMLKSRYFKAKQLARATPPMPPPRGVMGQSPTPMSFDADDTVRPGDTSSSSYTCIIS